MCRRQSETSTTWGLGIELRFGSGLLYPPSHLTSSLFNSFTSLLFVFWLAFFFLFSFWSLASMICSLQILSCCFCFIWGCVKLDLLSRHAESVKAESLDRLPQTIKDAEHGLHIVHICVLCQQMLDSWTEQRSLSEHLESIYVVFPHAFCGTQLPRLPSEQI